YSGRWSAYLLTSTCASKPVLASPLSMTWAGTGAWTSVSHWRHAHLPRMWRSTCATPGMKSNFSATSSPMRAIWHPIVSRQFENEALRTGFGCFSRLRHIDATACLLTNHLTRHGDPVLRSHNISDVRVFQTTQIVHAVAPVLRYPVMQHVG